MTAHRTEDPPTPPDAGAGDRVAQIRRQWEQQRPDLDTSGMAIIGRISRLARTLEDGVGTGLGAHDLKAHEFDVLATLRRSGPPFELHPQDLLDEMMVTSSTMTHRLGTLEARGLVTRRASAADRRRVIVALTDAGHDVADRAATTHFANERRLLDALTDGEQAQLEALLASLASALGT